MINTGIYGLEGIYAHFVAGSEMIFLEKKWRLSNPPHLAIDSKAVTGIL